MHYLFRSLLSWLADCDAIKSKTRLVFSAEALATSSASTPRHFATMCATMGKVQGSFRPRLHLLRRDLQTSSSSLSEAFGVMYGALLSSRILSSGSTPSLRASRKALPGTSEDSKTNLIRKCRYEKEMQAKPLESRQ